MGSQDASLPPFTCPPTSPSCLFLPPSLLKPPEVDSETWIQMQVVGGDPRGYEGENANTVSSLHTNEFRSEIVFISPICF